MKPPNWEATKILINGKIAKPSQLVNYVLLKSLQVMLKFENEWLFWSVFVSESLDSYWTSDSLIGNQLKSSNHLIPLMWMLHLSLYIVINIW